MEHDESYLRPSDEAVDTLEQGLPDDLVQELDQALESIQLDDAALDIQEEVLQPAAEDGLSTDPAIRQMQELFLEITRNTLGPVARYMKAIALGETARELLEISEYITTALIPKVEEVGLEEHAEELSFFRSLLLLALGERDQPGSQAMKEVVMEGFSKLTGRFDLSYRGYRLAVRNLVEFYRNLRSSESINESDIRKFFAIGVPSLTWVRRTKVGEMTSLSGIDHAVMGQIRKLAYEYRSVPPMASARLDRQDVLTPRPRQPQVLTQAAKTADVEEVAVLEGTDGGVPPNIGEA